MLKVHRLLRALSMDLGLRRDCLLEVWQSWLAGCGLGCRPTRSRYCDRAGMGRNARSHQGPVAAGFFCLLT